MLSHLLETPFGLILLLWSLRSNKQPSQQAPLQPLTFASGPEPPNGLGLFSFTANLAEHDSPL